jgi:hypothetical protein
LPFLKKEMATVSVGWKDVKTAAKNVRTDY